MLEIDNSFYEDEVCEGFYVPTIIKKAWAANLKVLSEVDRICKKYEIAYFAAYGTILGAIRHGGFIPWDDDLDIMMKRADYEKFLLVAEKELRYGYTILNVKNTDNYWHFLSRVATGKHMRFEEEYLEEMHGFPYITGLDIFVLDRLSSNPELEHKRDVTINYILAVADKLEGIEELSNEIENGIKQIESLCDIKINRQQSLYKIRKELYYLAIGLCSEFENDTEGKIQRLMPDVLSYKKAGIDKEFFDDIVQMPFEFIDIPVPVNYDQFMKHNYGNYMQVVKNCAGHDYPFFEKQKEQFEAVWGQKFPEYEYVQRNEDIEKVRSYKEFVRECLDEIGECFKNDNALELLVKAQELAIDLGTFIDELKGEGTETVQILEQLCENIYDSYQNGSVDQNLLSGFEKACSVIDKEILSRQEIIFVSFSSKYWNAFENVYQTELRNPQNDVYVIPIPYYYKKYDGSRGEEVFDLSCYSKEINILDYQFYDWELRHPEKVYIQYPYDDWNTEMTIPNEYYSENLWFYTEQLVYIPYFKVDDFDKKSERDYYNMKYYCTMPAVVNADKILIQSEMMRQTYIQKLTEFAGADTEQMWEEKIMVESDEDIFIDRKALTEKRENNKIVVYFVGFSQIYYYGMKCIEKMKSTFNIFRESSDKVDFIFVKDIMIEKNSEVLDKEVFAAYYGLLEELEVKKLCKIETNEGNIQNKKLVEMCDAYYGDTSRLANMFSRAHKPVMIQDIEFI